MDLGQISLPAKVAGLLSVVAFFVTVNTYQSVSENGVVVSCDYTDFGALVLGGAAAVIAAVAIVLGAGRRSLPSIALGAGALGLGLYHVAAGLGQVGNPCG